MPKSKLPYSIYTQKLDLPPVFQGSFKSKKACVEAREAVMRQGGYMTASFTSFQEEKPNLAVGASVARGVLIQGLHPSF